jgi:hypothetical protein
MVDKDDFDLGGGEVIEAQVVVEQVRLTSFHLSKGHRMGGLGVRRQPSGHWVPSRRL